MNTTAPPKPLGIKAYGHIPHLPGSRITPADKHCHEGQSRICTEKLRDRNDAIFVQEKVDGSCVAVAKIDGRIVPLGRAGYEAWTSKYEQHRMFALWVNLNEERFAAVLQDGERLVGEWLAQAHGTRYRIEGDPFVAFDIMDVQTRMPYEAFTERIAGRFVTAGLLHSGSPLSIEAMLSMLEPSRHGAIDPVEGAIWRVERRGEVDFLAKYVRPDKVDGSYLPELSGQPEVWNWRP